MTDGAGGGKSLEGLGLGTRAPVGFLHGRINLLAPATAMTPTGAAHA